MRTCRRCFTQASRSTELLTEYYPRSAASICENLRLHPPGAELALDRDIGLLFVHGIGQQERGDTLIQFGELIYRRLSHWFTGAYMVSKQNWTGHQEGFEGTRLRPTNTDAEAPPHTRLCFKELTKSRCDSESRKVWVHRWLLAECWWARVIRKPNFAELTRWSVLIAPQAILFHFGSRVRRLSAGSAWKSAASSVAFRER